MEWCKLFATFATDPKVRKLSDRAFRRYVEAMCDTTLHETDGRIDPAEARPTAELVTAGLWDRDIDGLAIHGWTNRQLTKEQIAAVREKSRERQRRHREGSHGVSNAAVTPTEVEVEVEKNTVTAIAVTPAPTLNQRANILARAYTDVQPMSRFPAIAGIVRTALKANHPDDDIRAALLRLAEEGRGVTTETLRVELEGLPVMRARIADPAGELIKGVLGESVTG